MGLWNLLAFWSLSVSERFVKETTTGKETDVVPMQTSFVSLRYTAENNARKYLKYSDY